MPDQYRNTSLRFAVWEPINRWQMRWRGSRLSPEHLALVRSEFDAGFYTTSYPDLGSSKDPLEHYLTYGWHEGRDPAPWFSTSAYLADNPDVAAKGVNPFLHFLVSGRREGRKPVSASEGAARLAATAQSPGTHRVQPGHVNPHKRLMSLLRRFRPYDVARILVFFRRLAKNQSRPSWMWSFDPVAYLLLNPDIAASEYRARPTRYFDASAKREHRKYRPQDVVDNYFGNSDKVRLEFTTLARAFLREVGVLRRRDPFECATEVLNSLGRAHRIRSSAHETIKLRQTSDQAFPAGTDASALRTVTVACHLYYTDEIEWLKTVSARFAAFDGLRFQYVFSLTETRATADVVTEIRRSFNPCSIYLTENRGHDIGALLSILRNESFHGSEWLVTLHGKKSTHNDPELVRGWKQALADSIVAGLADLDQRSKSGDLAALATIGGYFASSWRRKNMGKNGPTVTQLRKHFLPRPPPSFGVDYLSGSMMVTRMSVWREIAELTRDCVFSDTGALSAEERSDGLLEHGVERIVQEVAVQRGLTCIWN